MRVIMCDVVYFHNIFTLTKSRKLFSTQQTNRISSSVKSVLLSHQAQHERNSNIHEINKWREICLITYKQARFSKEIE